MARLRSIPGRLAPAASPLGPGSPRPSAGRRGYGYRWDKASRAFLRNNPLCRGCEAIDRAAPATLTDHVLPHTHGTRRFWDQAWWQASCAWHHNVVKQTLERKFDAGAIGADDLWLDSALARETTLKEMKR